MNLVQRTTEDCSCGWAHGEKVFTKDRCQSCIDFATMTSKVVNSKAECEFERRGGESCAIVGETVNRPCSVCKCDW